LTPLIFIFSVSAVLVLLLYWIMSTLDAKSQNKRNRNSQKYNKFKLKLSSELSNITPLKKLINQKDILRLAAQANHVLAYWHLSANTWNDYLRQLNESQPVSLVIKLNSSEVRVPPIIKVIDDCKGNVHFPSKPGMAYYAILGIKREDTFTPLLLSNTIISSFN